MNGSKNNIIEVLTHREDYISGEVISDEMGISRAAVWKHIKRLKEEGYKIASVRNKGYKLIAYPEQFVSAEIMDAIMDLNLVEQVITLDTIDSTNIEAKRLASVYPSQQMLIISEEQTAGVGRRGRVWQSQKGQGIYMSLLLRPELEPKHASKLTLLAGLAVSGAIRELTGLESYIKWPNDIVVNQKKVAGILTEIIRRFASLYETFTKTRDLSFMIDDYNKQCLTVNQVVQVISKGEVRIGNALQVNVNGSIKIEFNEGIEDIQSGEVSIRGLYGYV